MQNWTPFLVMPMTTTTSLSSPSPAKKGRMPTKGKESDYTLQVASSQLNAQLSALLPQVKNSQFDSSEMGSFDSGAEESLLTDHLETNTDSPDSGKSSSASSNHMDAESLGSACASVEPLQREDSASWGQAGRSGSNSSADSLRQSDIMSLEPQVFYHPTNEDVTDEVLKAGHMLKRRISRKHPARPKICDNCGTTAVLHKAKKCHNCGKFFFQHWARRCRIPPCPRCHYSRRSGGIKRLPTQCEKCNYPLFKDPTYHASADEFQLLPGTLDLTTPTSTDKGGVTAIVLARQSPERKSLPGLSSFSSSPEPGYSSSAVSFPSVGYGSQPGTSSSTVSHLLPLTSQTNSQQTRTNPLINREGDPSQKFTSTCTTASDSVDGGVGGKPIFSAQSIASQVPSTSVQPFSLLSVGSDEAKTRLKNKILGIGHSPPSGSPPPPKKPPLTEPGSEVGSDKPVSTVIACPIPDIPIPNPSGYGPGQFKLSTSGHVPPVSVSATVSTPVGACSSPLLEYAQKISARVMIPEEIKSQEKKTLRGKYSRYRKKSIGPGKQQPGKRKESPVPESQQVVGDNSSTGSPPLSPRCLGSPSMTSKNTQPSVPSQLPVKAEVSSPLSISPFSFPSPPSQLGGGIASTVAATTTTTFMPSLPSWSSCTSAPLRTSSLPPLLPQLSSKPTAPSPSVVTFAPPEKSTTLDSKGYHPIRPRPTNISLPNICHSYSSSSILGNFGLDQPQKYHSTTNVVGSDGRVARIPVHASPVPPPLVSQPIPSSATSKMATVLQPQSKYTIHDGKIVSQKNLQPQGRYTIHDGKIIPQDTLQVAVPSPPSFLQQPSPCSDADLEAKTPISVPPLLKVTGTEPIPSSLPDYDAPTQKASYPKQQVTVRKLPIPSQQVAHTTVIVDLTNTKPKVPLMENEMLPSPAIEVSETKTDSQVQGMSLTVLSPTSSSMLYSKEDEAGNSVPQNVTEQVESDNIADRGTDDQTLPAKSQDGAIKLDLDVGTTKNTEEVTVMSDKKLSEERSVLKKKKKKDKKKKKKRHHRESSGLNKDGECSRSHHRSHDKHKAKRKALKADITNKLLKEMGKSKIHSSSKKDRSGGKEHKSSSKKSSKSSKKKDGSGDSKKVEMNSDNEVENTVEPVEEKLPEIKEKTPTIEPNQKDSEGTTEQPSLYTVKLKDCAIHQFLWGEFRMTLLDPRPGYPATPSRDGATSMLNSTQGSVTSSGGSISKERLENEEEGEKEALPLGHGRLLRSRGRIRDPLEERKERREKDLFKPKKKTRRSYAMEEVENDDVSSNSQATEFVDDVDGDMSLTPSQSDIIPPSFTIYELRNKLFGTDSSRVVHGFTYKYRIKTYRPHLHWIHVLKIFGGLPEKCHMCRLLDVESVKLLCEMQKVDIPPVLDQLLNGILSSSDRKVIDISHEDPAALITKPSLLHDTIPNCPFFDVPPKKLTSRKRPHGDKLLENFDGHEQEEQDEAMEGVDEDEISEESAAKRQRLDVEDPMTKALQQDNNEVQPKEEPPQPEQEMEEGDDEEEIDEGEEEEEEEEELTKDRSLLARKKPCPGCGVNVARKSKKCHHCGKSFGVFTFGRRVCMRCNHINLARMHACFRCGLSLEKAPTAIPKDVEASEAQAPSTDESDMSAVKLDFKFGMRKRRKMHSLSSPTVKSQPHPSISLEEQQQQQSREVSRQSTPCAPDDGECVEEMKANNSGGYQYSKIPWNDADLALVISDDRIPRFCLQEMCSKVLRYLTKLDVFEVVKSLHLPIQQGDTTLLKKLQALGLHPNRSPICKLIAAEDLFALMDALQEPVPGEVHQHLEAINARTHESSPHESPGSQSAANGSSAAMPSVNLIEEDKEHSFESTLHEVMCSDGQYLSLIRAWNGDQLLCLLEVWRRYFPEVNRSHLSSVLKRLEIDTQVPTSQQTSLLRVAGIISVRGAPGRLVKLSDTRRLLEDLSIPLQIGSFKPEKKSPDGQSSEKFVLVKSPVVEPTVHGGVKEKDEECMKMAECMKMILDTVEPNVLMEMVQKTADSCAEQIQHAEEEIQDLSKEMNKIRNHILFNRELCKAFTDEVAFLTVTKHTQMAELVRLSHMSRQALHELDPLIDVKKLQVLLC